MTRRRSGADNATRQRRQRDWTIDCCSETCTDAHHNIPPYIGLQAPGSVRNSHRWWFSATWDLHGPRATAMESIICSLAPGLLNCRRVHVMRRNTWFPIATLTAVLLTSSGFAQEAQPEQAAPEPGHGIARLSL